MSTWSVLCLSGTWPEWPECVIYGWQNFLSMDGAWPDKAELCCISLWPAAGQINLDCVILLAPGLIMLYCVLHHGWLTFGQIALKRIIPSWPMALYT